MIVGPGQHHTRVYVMMVSTHSRAAAPASITPALELLLKIFPDGRGELPSCHMKSIRGKPCMTSRFVDKGIEADRRMTSSDVIGPGQSVGAPRRRKVAISALAQGLRAVRVRQSAAFF